jgi:hypothetical protein
MAVHLDIKTVLSSVLQVMRLTGRLPHHFLGNTANIDACSAQSPGLNHGNACAKLSRSSRVRDAATATAYYQKIKLFAQTPAPAL